MKKNINITIDESLYLQLKDSGKPISTTINNLLFSALAPKEANKDDEKKLLEELEIAKKFNLEEREFFLIKENFSKDIVSFWKLNKSNFSNIKSLFDFIEIRKAFEPLWSKETEVKIREAKT